MKLLIPILLVFGILLINNFSTIDTNNIIITEKEVPPYTKWGKIAMKKTKVKYPQAEIIDFLHLGREKGTEYSVEKFKLWLKEDNREFGIFIDIKFNNETEQIVDIEYKESTQ
ncbi:DUF3889 domain-containing protein [Ornithinibacillus salinisoli]|uniref:DUF3889 domain-containing protein n=1 Tax=Ornithinibacillus salinisoli TaxID=1848459 RepID=A0ABW4VV26_9BACI